MKCRADFVLNPKAMVKIIVTKPHHLTTVARCHLVAFPHSLATALGKAYVTKMLSWYLSTEKTFLFHIENEEGKCIGYCGGLISDGSLGTGSASGMAQYTFKAAIWAFFLHPWVLFHPEVRKKWPLLWRNIKMKLGFAKRNHFTPEQKTKMACDPAVGLVVIGVDPVYQGKGYGSILLQEFERKAVEEYGIKKLRLSVLSDNTQAIRAYERNGWIRGEVKGRSLGMWKYV